MEALHEIKGNRGTDYCFSVTQYLNSGLVFLVVAIYISHEIRHTYALGILCSSNQLVGEAAIYTTHIKHRRQMSMTTLRFEPAIAAIKR